MLRSLIAEGKAHGMRSLSKYVETLDAAGESKLLMALYAGANQKSETDVSVLCNITTNACLIVEHIGLQPDLVAFFKSRYWI